MSITKAVVVEIHAVNPCGTLRSLLAQELLKKCGFFPVHAHSSLFFNYSRGKTVKNLNSLDSLPSIKHLPLTFLVTFPWIVRRQYCWLLRVWLTSPVTLGKLHKFVETVFCLYNRSDIDSYVTGWLICSKHFINAGYFSISSSYTLLTVLITNRFHSYSGFGH